MNLKKQEIKLYGRSQHLNFMQIISNKWFFIDLALVFISLGSLVCFHQAFASEKRPEEVVFSIHATNEPIEKVLENISWASGYEIILKTGIKDLFVSIQLNNVTLQEAINRILRKYNHIEILNEKEKKLELYILESKDIPVSISGNKRKFEPTTKTTID